MQKNKKTGFIIENVIYCNNIYINNKNMPELKAQSVKLKGETIEKIKKLNIELAGVDLQTYDDKINHLIWFYKNYNKKLKSEIEDNLL